MGISSRLVLVFQWNELVLLKIEFMVLWFFLKCFMIIMCMVVYSGLYMVMFGLMMFMVVLWLLKIMWVWFGLQFMFLFWWLVFVFLSSVLFCSMLLNSMMQVVSMVGIVCRNIFGDGRFRLNMVYLFYRVVKFGVVKFYLMVGQGVLLNSGVSMMVRVMIGKIFSLFRVFQKVLWVFSIVKCLEKIRQKVMLMVMEMVYGKFLKWLFILNIEIIVVMLVFMIMFVLIVGGIRFIICFDNLVVFSLIQNIFSNNWNVISVCICVLFFGKLVQQVIKRGIVGVIQLGIIGLLSKWCNRYKKLFSSIIVSVVLNGMFSSLVISGMVVRFIVYISRFWK